MGRTQDVDLVRQGKVRSGDLAVVRKRTPFMRVWEVDNTTKRVDVSSAHLCDIYFNTPIYRRSNIVEATLEIEEYSIHIHPGPFEPRAESTIIRFDMGGMLFPQSWRLFGVRSGKYGISIIAFLDIGQAFWRAKLDAKYWFYRQRHALRTKLGRAGA